MNELILSLGSIVVASGVVYLVLRIGEWLFRPTAWKCYHCERIYTARGYGLPQDNPGVVSHGLCRECCDARGIPHIL